MTKVLAERQVRLVYWFDTIDWISFTALDLSGGAYDNAYRLPIFLHRVLNRYPRSESEMCKNATVYSVNYWLYHEVMQNSAGYVQPGALAATQAKGWGTFVPDLQPTLWYDWCRGIVGVGDTYKSMVRVPVDKFLSWDESEVERWAGGEPVSCRFSELDKETRRL